MLVCALYCAGRHRDSLYLRTDPWAAKGTPRWKGRKRSARKRGGRGEGWGDWTWLCVPDSPSGAPSQDYGSDHPALPFHTPKAGAIQNHRIVEKQPQWKIIKIIITVNRD